MNTFDFVAQSLKILFDWNIFPQLQKCQLMYAVFCFQFSDMLRFRVLSQSVSCYDRTVILVNFGQIKVFFVVVVLLLFLGVWLCG